MPGFKTHTTASAALGITYGSAGYFLADLPLTTCALAAGLCTVGGMLPDLDGDNGVPVRELVPLVAALVPALMLGTFQEWGLNREAIVLALAATYLLVRFGLGGLFKRFTAHRGMWHSIPAALNAGLITLLICTYQGLGAQMFKAAAVVLGFMSHLVLDEIYCVDLLRLRFKRSCGSALKLWSERSWATAITYAALVVLSVLAWRDPVVQQWVESRRPVPDSPAPKVGEVVPEAGNNLAARD